MSVGVLTWFYRRLRSRYPAAFLTVELHTAPFIVAGAVTLFSFYWEASASEFWSVLAIAVVLTELSVLFALGRTIPRLRPIRTWIAGERDEQSTAGAWTSAVGLPLDLVKRDLPLPVFGVTIPLCIIGAIIYDLHWLAFFPLIAAALVTVGYAAVLHYLAVEAGMRPVLIDINAAMSPRTSAEVNALPLRIRLMVALPLINLITGLVVAALTSEGGGGTSLGLDVLVAVAVATTISLELSLLLSKSILRPVGDLTRAVERVKSGDYATAVPVTTSDELGDLAASFNEMVSGLRERERIREAFGTYLDREVAEYILSEGFSEEGVEVDVSIVFCDVRDFTRFAGESSPAEVVAALNRLFEVIVPIIARYGGHVDKFEGDGLLAVFGAPEPFADHAERAVRAACEIAIAVNERDEGRAGLRVGIGVNSGPVVAGAIGGGGRLNFSVIGSAVNLAARVESATRKLDDEVLITAATRAQLGAAFEADSRGKVTLKGIEESVELYAPRLAARELVGIEERPTRERDGERPTTAARLRELARERIRR